MSLQELAPALRQALVALGLLFIVVDARVGWQIASWWRIRQQATITWPAPRPPFYAINLAIGVMLGILLFVTPFVGPRPASPSPPTRRSWRAAVSVGKHVRNRSCRTVAKSA